MKLYGGKPAKHAGSQKKTSARKGITVSIALILIICLAVGGTVAFLIDITPAITNIFNPANVEIKVDETFENNVKSRIQVENTGDTTAYIRVNLVTYMQDEDGNPTAEQAPQLNFNLNDAWVKIGDYYYHKAPVAEKELTADLLADGSTIELAPNQVVYVLAEGIQSLPTTAVTDAWNVTVGNDGNITAGGAGA